MNNVYIKNIVNIFNPTPIGKRRFSMYDAIIIGSGIGGMTCGALLAKNGLKTLIIEQHSRPGGYVTSYKRKGFTFDVVHVIGGLRKDAPLERVFTYLGMDKKVTFKEVDKTFRYVYPDMNLNCWTDIDRYEEELVRHFPTEEKGIKLYIQTSKRIWKEILSSYYHPTTLQFLSYPFRFPHLVRYQNATHQELLDQFISDGKLKEILGSGWGYLGLNNRKVSALYMVGMYMSYHAGGAWYPKGGYQAMSDAFAERFRELGGTLRLGTRVKKISTDQRRVYGVELETGEVVKGERVISNADTKRTFLELMGADAIGRTFAANIQGLEQSVSGLVVHLGINKELPRDLHCGCIMVCPEYGVADHQFSLSEDGRIEEGVGKFGFGLSVASLKDPTVAPPGCHAIDLIYMPAPHQYNNGWLREDKEQYEHLKARLADNLIKAAEKIIPDLVQHIIVKDISTPLTYERYTGATGGGRYDVACTPKQSSLNRSPATTPIKNLYLTGAKSFPGPGMFGAVQSGLFTADTILRKKLTKGAYVLGGR